MFELIFWLVVLVVLVRVVPELLGFLLRGTRRGARTRPSSRRRKWRPTYRQGRYQPRNPRKYRGNVREIFYRSGWEREAFEWCDTQDDVLRWSSEEIIIPYRSPTNGRKRRYYPDLLINMKGDKTLLVEIKPDRETRPPAQGDRHYAWRAKTYSVNTAKWEAARSYAEKRGWEFRVWTEKTMRNTGIISPRQRRNTWR